MLQSLVELLPKITDRLVKTSVLKHYARVIEETAIQEHPIFRGALEGPQEAFSRDTLNILSQIAELDPWLKEMLMGRLLQGEHWIVSYIAPHLEMAIFI